MMRCRTGIVTHTAFATVPDQRCTASLSLALHRIRDTSHLILALSAYGLVPPHDRCGDCGVPANAVVMLRSIRPRIRSSSEGAGARA